MHYFYARKKLLYQCCLHGEFSQNDYNTIPWSKICRGCAESTGPEKRQHFTVRPALPRNAFASISGLVGKRIKWTCKNIVPRSLVRFHLRPATNLLDPCPLVRLFPVTCLASFVRYHRDSTSSHEYRTTPRLLWRPGILTFLRDSRLRASKTTVIYISIIYFVISLPSYVGYGAESRTHERMFQQTTRSQHDRAWKSCFAIVKSSW